MKLNINQQTIEIENETPRPLLWVLRDELGLTGTKYGCGAGICGACTVHVDGAATRSCTTDVTTVAGKAITTIEGMAQQQPDGSWQLHLLQEAFIERQVPQCSWCMSGQMMTAAAFLAQYPSPSESEIVEAMGQNYCRCGCYVRIKDAVQYAAALLGETS